MLMNREDVYAVLAGVMDPEVPVISVVDLGIVRDASVRDGIVQVTVTPTYSGCPAMHEIEADIRSALMAAGASEVRVDTVFAPAWTTDWIGPDAREKLRAYGIAPPAVASSGDLVQLMRVRAAPQCPYCDSVETEIRSEFGSTACKAVCWCRSCRQPFEEFKAI